MIAENTSNKVTCWAKSTQGKVTSFLDDYLINFPVKSVRQSTRNLLNSLFKKGNSVQRQKILQLIKQRISKISTMGDSSSEFLLLITHLFQSQVQNKQSQRKEIFNLILQKGYQIIKTLTSNENYEFYAYIQNYIQFSTPLNPYLIQASGCMKCYGKKQFVFQHKQIKQIVKETKAHITRIQLVFNRIYSVKDLKINLGKKKLVYKTVQISYIDEKGTIKGLGGKYSIQDTIPNLQFQGRSLIFDFDYQKSKKAAHISCIICSNGNCPEQYCFICSVCFIKNIQIDGNFKIIGSDIETLETQLCEKYSELNQRKFQLQEMYESILNKKSTSHPNIGLIKQMQNIYAHIMKNLQLLNRFKQQDNAKSTYKINYSQCKQCFSCNIKEIENIIDFFEENLQFHQYQINKNLQFSSQEIDIFSKKFKQILKLTKLNKTKQKIYKIISYQILFKSLKNINYSQELKDLSSNQRMEVIFQLIRTIKKKQFKVNSQENFVFQWDHLAKYLNTQQCFNQWSDQQRAKIIMTFFLKSQLNELLEEQYIEKSHLTDINRLDLKQFKKLKNLSNFRIQNLLKKQITNEIKLFLSILPQSLVPSYSLQIKDPLFLNYIKPVIPIINDQLIYSNIVYTPHPIIKLNMFSTLPYLIKHISLEQSMKLLNILSKYNNLWNLNLKQTLNNFQQILDKQQKQKKLTLSLQGYQLSKQKIYLNKIYDILVPQRKNMIIRLQTPDAQIQKKQRSQGVTIQYVYLNVRQVKTQDLKGQTMKAVHDWVTQQLKKQDQYMPFDLIVGGYIIDKLQLPIELVYTKIAQKQMKKSIGKKQYDFMRVIYRLQGVIGDPLQSSCSNPRDQNFINCLHYSSYLLNRINAIKKTGLDVVMSIIQSIKRSTQDKQKRLKILKIIQIISQNTSIIKKIIDQQYSDIIINLTVKLFSLDENQIKTSQVLVNICSKIIKQANQQMINLRKKSLVDLRKQSDVMQLQGQCQQIQSQSLRTVKYLLQKIKQCQQKDRKDLAEKMILLLSFCSKDQIQTSKYLFEFFELQQTKINTLKNNKKLNWFLQFLQTLSESYTSFKIYAQQKNFTDQVIATILLYIESLKNLEEKKPIENVQTIELSLSILKGLIRGDQILQKKLFDNSIIHQIQKISKLEKQQLQQKNIKVGKVLTLSYQIIKYFKQGKFVLPEIQDYVKSKDQLIVKKNQQRKKSKMEQFKMRCKVTNQKFKNQLNTQLEKFICSTCWQGYAKKNQVLGIYIYSTKQQIPSQDTWWKQGKKQSGLTSVSYFTPIHFDCHLSMMQKDLKNQKTQWQGAYLRNSVVKCNGMIPIKGQKTTDQEYQKVNKKYFDKNTKPNYWVILNDLNGLLEKFANQYNFSQQTQGSGPLHNCKLILVLLASASHYMKKSQDLKFLQQGSKFIDEHMTKRGHLLNLYFCTSLFLNNYNDYQKKKEKYLRFIDNLDINDFKEKKKYYIYLALVNEIQNIIHITLKQNQKVYLYMDKYIPDNLNNLVNDFQKLSEKYKNIFLKWQSDQQAKEYFSK